MREGIQHKKLRAVVIDDEDLARRHLTSILAAQDVEVLAVGEKDDQALSLWEAHHPDILFLDVKMSGQTGAKTAKALSLYENPPLVVFLSAYENTANEVTQWNAFDFLQKPVDPDRLSKTIARAQDKTKTKAKPTKPSQSLNSGVRLLKVEEIEWAVAKGESVVVRVDEVDQRVQYTLAELEALLPADEFVRIHPSVLARLSRIEALNLKADQTHAVTMLGGFILPVGRNYHAALKARLDTNSEFSTNKDSNKPS